MTATVCSKLAAAVYSKQAAAVCNKQAATVCSKQAATKSEKSKLHTKNAQAGRLQQTMSRKVAATIIQYYQLYNRFSFFRNWYLYERPLIYP